MTIPEENQQENISFRGSVLPGEAMDIQEESKSEGDKVLKGFSFSDQLPPQEVVQDPVNQQPKVYQYNKKKIITNKRFDFSQGQRNYWIRTPL